MILSQPLGMLMGMVSATSSLGHPLRTATNLKRGRLTYISDQTYSRQPILIEIADGVIVIAGATDADPVMRFTVSDTDQLLEQVAAWMSGFSPEKYYCLLLLKPSGLGVYERLRNRLQEQSFDIGIDLLPEEFSATMKTAIHN